METIITIALVIAVISIFYLWRTRLLKKKYPPGSGKKCTLTGTEYSLCTPPVKGDSLNGTEQTKKVVYYRELKRKEIYKAEDGFQIVGITYEYWD